MLFHSRDVISGKPAILSKDWGLNKVFEVIQRLALL
jgi:hypothetical protein